MSTRDAAGAMSPAEPTWPALAPRRRVPRAVPIALAVLVLGGAAFGGWKWAHRAPALTFNTAPVERGDVVSKVTASGALAAVRTVDVSSQVSGRIASIAVDFNSPVKKGQVLARLDTELLIAAREQARANLSSAQAALRRAQAQEAVAGREAARLGQLVRGDFIAASELDTARTNAEVARTQTTSARASLAQAEASVRQAEVNLGYAAIVSPIDGVVIARNVAVGATVAASLSAPVLFVLAQDLRKLEVHAAVSEADVGRLKAGMPTTFTVDAYPGSTFDGKVRQIRNQPTTTQNVVTYDAVVDAENPDGKLRIGMTANVNFIEADHEDVLKVPNAALRYMPSEAAFPREGRGEGRRGRRGEGQRDAAASAPAAGPATAPATAPAGADKPEGAPAAAGGDEQPREGRRRRFGGQRVWLQDGAHVKPVRVETGLTDGAYTEITSGDLKEGDLVVIDEAGAAAGAGAGGAPRQQGQQGGRQGGGNRRGMRAPGFF